MPKQKQWQCVSITRKLHALKDSDYSNVLAELLDLLLNNSSLPKTELVPVKLEIPYKKKGDL